jgi:hypothetical protein
MNGQIGTGCNILGRHQLLGEDLDHLSPHVAAVGLRLLPEHRRDCSCFVPADQIAVASPDGTEILSVLFELNQ